MGDKAVGMIDKFKVTRTDGSDEPGGKHGGCQYFVLDLTHDPHARTAANAYADSCYRAGFLALAADLRTTVAICTPRGPLLRGREERVMRWVKVSERLSEFRGRVTLLWGTECDGEACPGYCTDSGHWRLDAGDDFTDPAMLLADRLGEVTHWLEWETPAKQDECDAAMLRGLHASSLSEPIQFDATRSAAWCSLTGAPPTLTDYEKRCVEESRGDGCFVDLVAIIDRLTKETP